MHTIVQSIELIGSVGMTLSAHVARIHGAAAPYVDNFLADRCTAGAMRWTGSGKQWVGKPGAQHAKMTRKFVETVLIVGG